MRYALLLALGATCAWPAIDFTTGQAARLVIGQKNFTAADNNIGQTTLGGVSGVAYANDTLFVVDGNRLGIDPLSNRIMIFRNLRSQLPAPTDEIPEYAGRCPVCVGTPDTVLGQPDFTTKDLKAASDKTLRSPMGIATDGKVIAVADTDNNRVLIWNFIPVSNQAAADVVLGQADFSKTLVNEGNRDTPSNRSMRGPQGVWIQNGKLFVADTGNNRVLIWNRIPTSNFSPADVVVGAPNFNTSVQTDLTKLQLNPDEKTLYSPVSVTSDGTRMFISDLGHNRVLIWNTIPTSNNASADVVLGQPNFKRAEYNNVLSADLSKSNPELRLCASTGTNPDDSTQLLYPSLCEATLGFPRFALSDGQKLFIADGGNDRILVYNTIPTTNGKAADAILGQITPILNLISDSADPGGIASARAVRSPLALAYDGTNLYASDPYNRRVMVFTMADRKVSNTGIRNAASLFVFAVGAITLSGEVKENAVLTLKIGEKEYKYTAKKDDKLETAVTNLVEQINAGAGDPLVFASANLTRLAIILTARQPGEEGNTVAITATVGTDVTGLVASTSGATLQGGQDAAQLAPGTLVSIQGERLAETTASVPLDTPKLPIELGGVQVYFDGIRAPLVSVSPTEIRAQIPWEVLDAQSINAYVRTKMSNGEISVATPVSIPIIKQNPGIFAAEGVPDPRPGLLLHGSPYASGTVSVDGSVKAGDIATVVIEDREYSYTVVDGDTLATIRDNLIDKINADPKVQAFAAGAFTRIRLRARQPGPEGNDIIYSAKSQDNAQVIMTATTPRLCCANSGPITQDNPAAPGETIIALATGLGLVTPEEGKQGQKTGEVYDGPALNTPVEFVSSLAGGKTANVLSAGMRPGFVGLFEVALELNSDLPTDAATQLTIAQDIYVSNIITFPLVNPNPPASQ
jgi:hypothetical protein